MNRSTPRPLPAPPAYLAAVPDSVMSPHTRGTFARRLEVWLTSHDIPARPTLLEVAAERARRSPAEPMPSLEKKRHGKGAAERRAARRAAEAASREIAA